MTQEPPTATIGAHRPPVLTDRDVLDDHALRQQRLRGALTRGQGWRKRDDRGTARRMFASLLVAALGIGLVAVVAFMQAQLELTKRQEQEQQRRLNPPTSSAPATPGAVTTPRSAISSAPISSTP